MELETPAPRPSRRRRAPSPKAADRDDAVVDAGPTRTKRRRLTLPEPGALHAELDPSSPALPSAGEGSPIATLSSDLLLHVLDWVGVLSKRALFIVVPAVCTRWQLACTAHVRIELDMGWAVPRPGGVLLFGNPVRATDILKIMRRFAGVRTIRLASCNGVNEHGVGRILKAAEGPLTSLCLHNCNATDAILVTIAKRWGGTLRRLGLGKTQSITDAGLKCLAERCHRLESILLHDSGLVSDDGIVELLTSCPLLVELGLGGITRLTDDWLDKIAEACPRLEAISLAKCYLVTDMGLAKLSAACPRLHSISLESTKNLTEAALFTLAAGCKELRSINLKLRGPADLAVTDAVTDAVLEKLGVCCPLLRSINIMSSLAVTDIGVAKLAAGCRGLRWVAMSGCTKVTDTGIAALAYHCSELQVLFVGCCKVTDAALFSIAAGCPRIHSLNLYNVMRVTAAGLRAVADGCPKVAWIRVSTGPRVKDLQDAARRLFAPGALANNGSAYPRPFPADLSS